ncbi:hypothetical protein JCM3774_001254 [Rhodotorula dairenensis]
MATLGALTPWLEREFLSQRNKHADAFPASQLDDPKRVQLITATGTWTENGEELVWTEVADGSLWIHCCFPKELIDQFDRSSAGARPFTSYSASKGLFRLLRYRFVLASPLIPAHTSPRKVNLARRHGQDPTEQPRLRSLRVCLRVDEFKLFSHGQGSLLGNYQDFRKYPGPAPAPSLPTGQRHSSLAQERVDWVTRVELARFVKDSPAEAESKPVASDAKVEFLQDVRRPPLSPLQGTSDPKPRFRKPSPPPPPDLETASAPFSPIASTSKLTPLALPEPSTSTSHRPIPSVRQGVPAYVPLATWPADEQPIQKIDWREGEERLRYERRRHDSSKKKKKTGGKAATNGGAAAAAPAIESNPVKVDWTFGAETLQQQQQSRPVASEHPAAGGGGVEQAGRTGMSAPTPPAPPPTAVSDPPQPHPPRPSAPTSSSSATTTEYPATTSSDPGDKRNEASRLRTQAQARRRGPPLVPRPPGLVGFKSPAAMTLPEPKATDASKTDTPLQSIDVRAEPRNDMARAVDGRSAYARVAAGSAPLSSSPLTSLPASTSVRSSSPCAERTVHSQPETIGRRAKRQRDNSENGFETGSEDGSEDGSEHSAVRRQNTRRRPERPVPAVGAASELFRSGSASSTSPGAKAGERRSSTTTREDSILSQDVHGARSDLSEEEEEEVEVTHSGHAASPSSSLSEPSDDPERRRHPASDGRTADTPAARAASSSPAASALLQNPFSPWTQTLDLPSRTEQRPPHEEVKMQSVHQEGDDVATVTATEDDSSPGALTRQSRASPGRVAVPSPIVGAEATAPADQDFGETLLDSALLIAASPSSSVSVPAASQGPRRVAMTWNIKPEVFDFGSWCRANGITA